MSHRPTIFLHIPKTAGTTLRFILEDFYDKSETFKLYENEEHSGFAAFKKLTDAEKRKIKFFLGHMPFGLHREIPQECKYITMLRDPVEQFISYHNHMKTIACDSGIPEMRRKWAEIAKMNLEEYTASNIFPFNYNFQVNLLSDRFDYDYKPRDPSDSADRPPTTKHLEEAKHNLKNHFSLIGLTERFDESIILARRILGIPIPYFSVENRGQGRKAKREYPQKTLDRIAEKNSLDMELYQYAVKLFNEQVERFGLYFERKLIELRKTNERISTLLQEKDDLLTAQNDLLRKLHLDADSVNKRIEAAQLAAAEAAVERLKSSWSWRITAPVRKTIALGHKLNNLVSKK